LGLGEVNKVNIRSHQAVRARMLERRCSTMLARSPWKVSNTSTRLEPDTHRTRPRPLDTAAPVEATATDPKGRLRGEVEAEEQGDALSRPVSSFSRPDWRDKSTLIDYDFLFFYSNLLVFCFSQETYTQHGIIYEDYQQSWEPRVSAKGVSTRFMRNKALFVGCGLQDWDNWSIFRLGMQASQLRRQTK
jgi:hypothetical protein